MTDDDRRQISFKKLAYVIVEAGKFEMCRLKQKAGNSGLGQLLQS